MFPELGRKHMAPVRSLMHIISLKILIIIITKNKNLK